MNDHVPQRANIPFYKAGNLSKPDSYKDRFEVYEAIKNGSFKEATEYIQQKYRDSFLAGWDGFDKTPYQKESKRLFSSVVFSGADRSINENRTHTGILCADIDENTKDELLSFGDEIKAGAISFIEAAALSKSGVFTGGMWANFRIQIPTAFRFIPSRLSKALNLTKKTSWSETLNRLHRAYGDAFAHILKRERNITLGARDLKRGRYLTHDENIYINKKAEQFSLLALEKVFLDMMKGKSVSKRFEGQAVEIHEKDAFKFAEKFASLEYTYDNRQLYISRLSIALNLLGVKRELAEKYVSSVYPDYDFLKRDGISYPYLKYADSFGLWRWKLKKQNRRTIQGEAGAKCSDLLKEINIDNSILIAPTGTGKTYHVAHLEGCKVIACPTNALVSNVCEEYKHLAPIRWDGKVNKNNRFEMARLEAAKFIVTTYASFERLTKDLQAFGRTKEFSLFVDEMHHFSASNIYQKDLSKILEYRQVYKSFTAMTGTEVFTAHPDLKKIPIIEIKVPKPERQAYTIEASNTLKAAALRFNQSNEKGRFPILLFDNASDAGRLGAIKDLLGSDGIQYFNSHTKENEDWQVIVKKGMIPEHIKGFVTTSVLKEGNNIYNEYDFDIIVLGNFHHSSIEQFSNRARRAKSLDIYLIKSERRTISEDWFNPTKFAAYAEKKVQAAIDEFSTSGNCSEADLVNEVYARRSIQSIPIKQDENGFYSVDFLKLSNDVIAFETMKENQNLELLKHNLSKYSINLNLKPLRCLGDYTPQEKNQMALGKSNRKKEKKAKFEKAVDSIGQAPCPITHCQKMLTSGHSITQAEKLAFKWFLKYAEILNYPNKQKKLSPILDTMKGTGASNAKLLLEYRRLIVRSLTLSAAYMDSNRKFTICLKAIRSRFKKGKLYTIEQLKGKLLKCLALDTSFDLERFEQERSAKVLSVLRMFFEVKQERQQRNGEKREWLYSVNTLKFNGLGTKSIKKVSHYFECISSKSNKNSVTNLTPILCELGYPENWDK